MPLPLGMMRIERQHKVRGRRTTIVLEATYWDALELAAEDLGRPLTEIVTEVAGTVPVRSGGQGESYNRALRVWVVEHFRQKLERVELEREE